MSDEIKDKNGLEEEKSPNLVNSSAESEQDAAEDDNGGDFDRETFRL